MPWPSAIHTSNDSIRGDFVAFYIDLDNIAMEERRGVTEEVITQPTGEGNPLL
jgi:hypothetical protein